MAKALIEGTEGANPIYGPNMSYETLKQEHWRKLPDFVPYADDLANGFATPSGKIEIYSETLAGFEATWELAEDEVVTALPIYDPGFLGYEACTEEYPLQITGFHYKAHTHSSYANNEVIQTAAQHVAWVNPADAEARGIKNGDMVSVTNERGEVHVEARVTPRIIPGQVGMPEGAWAQIDFDGDGIDRGGNINVLCNSHPSPLSKHNCSNSAICQVTKL